MIKFARALKITPTDTSLLVKLRDCLTQWSALLRQWAKTENEKKATKLLFRSCEKLEEAHKIDPGNPEVLRDWGVSLYEVAELKKGEKHLYRLNLAREKLEASLSSLPDDAKVQLYWSRTLRAIAMTQMDDEERQFLESLLETIRESGYEV